jgi:signal transduction histidine kinase
MRESLLAVAGPNIRIDFDVAPAIPPVMAAPDEIQDMLKHLVVNAVEAMEAGGTVSVKVDCCKLSANEPGIAPQEEKFRPGTYVRIKVADTGPGMPAEIAERAFDPFFSTKFQGRGLGLSVVLGVMRGHEGAVRLQTARNSGTSVELLFPAATPEQVIDSAQPGHAEAAAAHHS